MFVTGPEVVKEVTSEDIAFDELGGAMVHNTKSGVAHFACDSDEEAIATVRDLLSYLPQNNRESPPQVAPDDDPGRTDPELDTIMPDRFSEVYDVKRVIRSIVDNGKMLESHRYFAPNIITCFARMGGKSVGIMANQPMYLAGCLDVNASDKAARFIRFCDAFNIPLISILDIPGYLPGKDQEWAGIIRHGAKIPWSYAEATIPKIVLITRKTYGGAYIVMCSKQLGFDYILAWPTAEIAVMGAEGATPIIFKKEIGSSDNPQHREKELKEEYRRILYNPYVAASRGYIDTVIEPRMTRPYIIQALEMLSTKRQVRPERKHGNIPL
jgi:acetyl-CoA carboxylase carboxyltransferase component